MGLNKIFLWLDIDNTILDSKKFEDFFVGKIVEKNVPGGSKEFWQIYYSQKESDGRVDIDIVIKIWAKRHDLSINNITKDIKKLTIKNFVYKDFREFSPKLEKLGGYGFFSNGAPWFQKQKILKVKKFLNLKLRERNFLLARNKRDLFPKMRGISKDLYSLYVDDRLPILRAALEGNFVDWGILIRHDGEEPGINDKKILVIENFGQLMSKLSKVK